MLNTNYNQSDANTVKLYNRSYSEGYRKFDEEYISSPDYEHFAPIIKGISERFDRPIKVLEVGCGTGRYFHLLQNTYELTGIDISEHMLKLAENPTRSGEVDIAKINLVKGSVFDHDFGNEKFDFIYSIGVLGEHAPFTLELCTKLYNMITDGGCLYTTIVDINDRKNLKRKVAETAYPLLPAKVQAILDKRWVTNYMTKGELHKIMVNSPFQVFEINNYKHSSKGWSGAHHECRAYKCEETMPFFS